MLKYETLLDLSAQRLATIADDPNHTRQARKVASDLRDQACAELASLNRGRPLRALVKAFFADEKEPAHASRT